jgi:hypothetical protein
MKVPATVTTVALSAVLFLAIVAIAGCGGGAARVYDQSQVIAAAKLIGSGPWHTQQGCEVAVVMTNKAQVKLYKDAGDVVATNPSETAGVKIVGTNEATCLRQLTKRLEFLG